MNIFNLKERDLAFVSRWAITRNIRQRSVAEHSYYVALWSGRVAAYLMWGTPMDRMMLMNYALIHDVREAFSGDIPSPFESAMGEGVDTTRFDKYLVAIPEVALSQISSPSAATAMVKFCDLLEAAISIAEEASMGNKTLQACFDDIMPKLEKACKNLPTEDNKVIDKIWLMAWAFIQGSAEYQSGI